MLWHGVRDADGTWDFASVDTFQPHQVVAELVLMGYGERYATGEGMTHALFLQLRAFGLPTTCSCSFCEDPQA
jgi:hypothetical protein